MADLTIRTEREPTGYGAKAGVAFYAMAAEWDGDDPRIVGGPTERAAVEKLQSDEMHDDDVFNATRSWLEADHAALQARVVELEGAAKLALEYWSHRQKRYKNRSPVWVQNTRAALVKWGA